MSTTTIPPRSEEHADPSACPPTAGGRRALRGAYEDRLVGRTFGDRRVLAITGWTTTDYPRTVRAICGAGHIAEMRIGDLRTSSGQRCVLCSRRAQREAADARWQGLVGTRRGTRTIVAYRGIVDLHPLLLVRCDCGDERLLRPTELRRRCSACIHAAAPAQRDRERIAEGRGSLAAILAEAGQRAPHVWRWNEPACVEAVAEIVALIGRPLSLEEVGALLGFTRERARQIEMKALVHMRAAAQRAGLEPADERSSGSWDAWGASAEASAEMGW